jgi:lipooligosaccharide transport system permease protein
MSTPAYARALEYHLLTYRRIWRGTVVTSFLNPVLFLAAMGLGLGQLVNQSNPTSLGGQSYVVFLAPGLLAATALQVAAGEATWPVLACLKWARTYHAQVATPLRPVDIGSGHLLYITFRALVSSVVFFAVMAVFGAVTTPGAPLAIPAAALTAMAFATPVVAYAVSADSERGFSAIYRFIVIPMFLFSGTFFPISQLPAGIRWLAWLTPLWHGVELCRGLALGGISAIAMVGHTLVLVLYTVVGTALALQQYNKRLAA